MQDEEGKIKDRRLTMKREKRKQKSRFTNDTIRFDWDTQERGTASVEMVFVLLIFSVLFFGALELAREVAVKHALDVGTYRAARYLSLVPQDETTARNLIQTELDANVLGRAGSVTMQVEMPSPTFQTEFRVIAQVPYQPLIPLLWFAPKTLRVIHAQSIEAYP